MNTQALNEKLQAKSPIEIVKWALSEASNPIVTTNFRPYEAVILHMAVAVNPKVKVLWVDSGYNTSATYRFAHKLIKQLSLNVITYIPQQTTASRNVLMGGIPDVTDPLHEAFTEQVKLEPFRRALNDLQPDYWLNAIRKEQTEFRQSLEIISESKEGVVKVAPLFHMKESELEQYLLDNDLPNEMDYYDPTKAQENRECGLHTRL